MQPRTGRKGEGNFDRPSLLQSYVIEQSRPLIQQAIAQLRLPNPVQNLTLVDFGCSSEQNSFIGVQIILEAIREHYPTCPVSLVFNGLPGDNFNRLFQRLNAPENPPFPTQPEVFSLAATASCYQRILPPQTMHLGFSAATLHWLSQIPASAIQDHIYFAGATTRERIAFARQAAADWNQFLQDRARELVPDGKLVLMMLGSLEPDPGVAEPIAATRLLDLMNLVLREMVGEGMISPENYAQFCFPLYCRTLNEAIAGMTDAASPLAGLFSIDYASLQELPCPLYADYLTTGDLAAYTRDYSAFIRGCSETWLMAGLFEAEPEGAWALENFYTRL